jgi:site-specific DNA-methyltransferase (adenine-specific)
MAIEALKNRIINADFRDVLKELPDKSVDLLLTDPPYAIDIVRQLVKKDPYQKHGYKSWELKEWDKERPSKKDFEEMIRVSKNQIIWGGNYFADLLPASQGWLVWNKGQRDFSLADGELAWTSYDKALRIFDYSRAQALRDGKIHPTQKPVALFEWILNLRTKENDLILDCYSGSGTTAVACHNLRRNFICIEKDSDYYKSSVQRLETIQAQMRIF